MGTVGRLHPRRRAIDTPSGPTALGLGLWGGQPPAAPKPLGGAQPPTTPNRQPPATPKPPTTVGHAAGRLLSWAKRPLPDRTLSPNGGTWGEGLRQCGSTISEPSWRQIWRQMFEAFSSRAKVGDKLLRPHLKETKYGDKFGDKFWKRQIWRQFFEATRSRDKFGDNFSLKKTIFH